jgi:hypothetical protein
MILMIGQNIKSSKMRFIGWKRHISKAESAFISNPANEDAKTKIDGLKKKLKEIEKKLNESLSMYR